MVALCALLLAAPHDLAVRVTSHGKPVAGATVCGAVVDSGASCRAGMATTGDDGAATLHLVATPSAILAWSNAGLGSAKLGNDTASIELIPAGNLVVHVLNEAGNPIAHASARINPGTKLIDALPAGVARIDPKLIRLAAYGAGGATDASGVLRVGLVPTQDLSVDVAAPGYVRFHGAAKSGEPLEVTLAQGSRIEVTVAGENDLPAQGMCEVKIDLPGPNSWSMSQTTKNGHASFVDIAPGTWTSSLKGGSGGGPVNARAGETVQIVLHAPPGGCPTLSEPDLRHGTSR